MSTLITIAALVGALAVFVIILIACTYPNLLVSAGKFLFYTPFAALIRLATRNVHK